MATNINLALDGQGLKYIQITGDKEAVIAAGDLDFVVTDSRQLFIRENGNNIFSEYLPNVVVGAGNIGDTDATKKADLTDLLIELKQATGGGVIVGSTNDATATDSITDAIGLFSCRFSNTFESNLWDVVNNGAATGAQNNSYTINTTTNGDYRVLQTFQRFGSNDTDSLSVHFKFRNIACDFGTKWVGWGQVNTGTNYLPYDGVFFYGASGQIGFSFNALGSTVDNVLQADWNIDKLDGTGASQTTADWTGQHHLIMDILPRFSVVLFSFVLNGIKTPVHKAAYTNNNFGSPQFNAYQSEPVTFGHLNLNLEPFGSDSFTVHAVNILANSSPYNFAKPFSLNSGTTVATAALIANTYPIFTFRFKSGQENTVLKLLNLSFTAVGANDSASLALLINPTLSAAIAYTPHPDAPIEYHYNSTGAITVTSLGYEEARIMNTKNVNSDLITNVIGLGKSITGTRNTFCLAINPRNNNVSYVASLNLAYNI